MPKDANKLDIFKLVKSETYPEENVLGEDGLNRYPYQPCEQHSDQKMIYRLYLEYKYIFLYICHNMCRTACKVALTELLYIRH